MAAIHRARDMNWSGISGNSDVRGVRVVVDPAVVERLRQSRPDVFERVEKYRQIADACQDPILLLPDLGPDDGLPVGAAMLTRTFLFPLAPGTDLGCGYSCWVLKRARSKLKKSALRSWVQALQLLAGSQWSASDHGRVFEEPLAVRPPGGQLAERVRSELEHMVAEEASKLASGNHFIEIHEFSDTAPEAAVSEPELLLIVHNGSVGVGRAVQKYGIGLAAGGQRVAPEHLPYLSLLADSVQGRLYLSWVAWAQRFAAVNRSHLTARAISVLREIVGHVDAEPLSDLLHSGITIVRDHLGTGYWHHSGTQLLRPGQVAFVGGEVGGSGFLVSPVTDAEASGVMISHGSGEGPGGQDSGTVSGVVSNLPSDTLRLLGRKYRSASSTIDQLMRAGLAVPLARTKPLAVVKKQRLPIR